MPHIRVSRPVVQVEKVSQGKAVKIGESSFMLKQSTHSNISQIADIQNSTAPDAIRFVLDQTSRIVLERLKLLSRINAEGLGAEIDGAYLLIFPPDIEAGLLEYKRINQTDRWSAIIEWLRYAHRRLAVVGFENVDEEAAQADEARAAC